MIERVLLVAFRTAASDARFSEFVLPKGIGVEVVMEGTSAHDAPPNTIYAYWMPFTPNRRWKRDPRFVVSA